jgi:hypothetical protein
VAVYFLLVINVDESPKATYKTLLASRSNSVNIFGKEFH